jgi:hypothetical protein
MSDCNPQENGTPKFTSLIVIADQVSFTAADATLK